MSSFFGFAYKLWSWKWLLQRSLTKSWQITRESKMPLMHQGAEYQCFTNHRASDCFFQFLRNRIIITIRSSHFFNTVLDISIFWLFILGLPIIYIWKYSQQVKLTPKWETNKSPTVHTTDMNVVITEGHGVSCPLKIAGGSPVYCILTCTCYSNCIYCSVQCSVLVSKHLTFEDISCMIYTFCDM